MHLCSFHGIGLSTNNGIFKNLWNGSYWVGCSPTRSTTQCHMQSIMIVVLGSMCWNIMFTRVSSILSSTTFRNIWLTFPLSSTPQIHSPSPLVARLIYFLFPKVCFHWILLSFYSTYIIRLCVMVERFPTNISTEIVLVYRGVLAQNSKIHPCYALFFSFTRIIHDSETLLWSDF
jgi:hypothetical protein